MENKTTLLLAEGGVCIAMSLALSYLKIPVALSFGGFGGSIDLVMIPLIVFAVRWGCGWGVLAGLAFGTLKYFVGSGFAVNWISIIFDYFFNTKTRKWIKNNFFFIRKS